MLEALSCVGQIIQDLRADLGDECEVGLVGVRLNHALYSPGLWAEWFASLYYQKKKALII